MLFTPNSLTFSNNKGMYVEILDEEGISIVSDKKITLISDEAVAIASTNADIKVTAPEGVVLEQGNARIAMQENVVMSGAQVVAQE